MRVTFYTIYPIKKAAKALRKTSKQPLSQCHQVIAKAAGYRDFHDLQQSLISAVPRAGFSPTVDAEVEIGVIAEIAKSLGINAGDVQHELSVARVFWQSTPDIQHTIRVRSGLFEKIELLPAGRREVGQIGKLKTAGRNGEHVILRKFGRPTRIISHMAVNGIVADFEYVSPRSPLPLFIPMRLYLPYGCWTEVDGAKVLFSRDYCPLWRLRESCTPERMMPWDRIGYVNQVWFWDDARTPWSDVHTYSKATQVLKQFGIRSMPVLANVLPIVVHRDDVVDVKDAIDVLRETYLEETV